MAQKIEIVSHFHKLLEGQGLKDLGWAEELQEAMIRQGMSVDGRPICPVLRPHFLSSRQYQNLVKTAETLMAGLRRIERLALEEPQVMTRLALLPAERMLAQVDPGYETTGVAAVVRTHVKNGTLRLLSCEAGTPVGVGFTDVLGDLFEKTPPMRDLAKRFALSRVPGAKPMVEGMMSAWREFSGGRRAPVVAVVGPRQSFQTLESAELQILRRGLEAAGCQVVLATPDSLEYFDRTLRANGTAVQMVLRRIKLREFLVRYGLDHPLVQAYREGSICLINSFRSEMADKMSVFDLLSDEEIVSRFPAAERKALSAIVPWTRVVGQRQTRRADRVVDLPEFIRANREGLVLRPNGEVDDQQPEYVGSEMDEKGWDRAIQTALRSSYVVQEAVDTVPQEFPLLRYGMLEVRKMRVDVRPQAFLGQVHGCGSWVSTVGSGFSSASGLAPVFLVS
jgi:hypothetical protein